MIKTDFRLTIESTPDALDELAKNTRSMMDWKFGETFTMQQKLADTGNSFSINVKQCFYHNFFNSHGAPELTQVFCDWDRVWSDELNAEHHGIEFSRPTTLSAGDEMCRFIFTRKVRDGKADQS